MSNAVIHNEVIKKLEDAINRFRNDSAIAIEFEIEMDYGMIFTCHLGIQWSTIDMFITCDEVVSDDVSDISVNMKTMTDKMIVNTLADVIFKRMAVMRREAKKTKNKADKECATMLANLETFCSKRSHEFKFGFIPDSVVMDEGIFGLDVGDVVEPVFKVSNGDNLPEESVKDFVKNGIEYIKAHIYRRCEYRRKVDGMILRVFHPDDKQLPRTIRLEKYDGLRKVWTILAKCLNYHLAVGLEQSFIFAINDYRFKRFVHGSETPDTNFTTEDNKMELTYNDIYELVKYDVEEMMYHLKADSHREIKRGIRIGDKLKLKYYLITTESSKYIDFGIEDCFDSGCLLSVNYVDLDITPEEITKDCVRKICERLGIDIPKDKKEIDFEQKYWDAQRTIDEYARENEELNTKLNKSYAACTARDVTINELKEKVKEANDFTFLRNKVKMLEQENEEFKYNMEKLVKEAVKEIEEDLEAEKKKHQKATELCKMNADIIADLKWKYDRKSEAYSDLLVKNRSLEIDKQLANDRIDYLEKAHNDLLNQVKSLEKANKNLKFTIDFAYKAVKGLTDNNKLLGDDIQILEENLECQASIDLVDDKD